MGTLHEDLLKVLEAHGQKADDVKSTESDKEKELAAAKAAKDSSKVEADIGDLATKIAEKIADKVVEAKGLGKDDKDDIQENIKTKIYTSWGGIQEVEYPTDLKALSKDEKIVTFFKALFYSQADPDNSGRVLRALVEGTDSEGGYLVPEELRSEIFRILPDLAIMRKLGRVLPMSTDTLRLNSLTARPVAYWTGEYASKSTTSAEFGQVTLTPNDLVCLLPVSDQLLADANIDLVSFIISLFTEAIALAEDKAFFTGSGTGQPRGINQESLSSVAAGGSLSFDNVIALIDATPSSVSGLAKAAFVGHKHVKSIMRGIKDSNGNFIWRDGGTAPGGGSQTGRLPNTLYGYDFFEQNDLNQSELYFGDWSNYIIGDRQTISVRTTTEGGEAWRRNSMEIKAVERVDGRAVITGPFAKITGI